ncbi:acetylajmalan esterase-like [Coffea eugenioides]|uniref:Acetylajmalan esterase-like n=1 Tax=Coffea arabica TaxID=13443 RepID=A0A6P6SV04_COFAR|nr:acetylajmalan esterase-like [Coffea arabica]XP_027174036.1 acetylajmalan esterase-like [Coffea eugenioides]
MQLKQQIGIRSSMAPGFTFFYSSLLTGLYILVAANASRGNFLCPFDSLYQFGDSISDTGNLIRVPGVGPTLPAARFPYGQTIGRPTGRWSDGLLIIDFTAMDLHLPLLNPYLDRNASFNNGVNFAVAGSTALDFVFFTARGIVVPIVTSPLGVQVNSFKQYLSSICSSPTECSTKLRQSLFWVGEIGGNDINYAFTQGKSLQEIRTYIPSITQAIINNTRQIIQLGAKRIVVPGNFPLGCIPVALNFVSNASSLEFDEFGCSRSFNDLARYQNSYLQTALNSLRKEFPDAVIVYADFYGSFRSVLTRARFLGFDAGSLLQACCGIGGPYNYDMNRACGSPGVPVCPNPRRFIHWDGLHLTQEAYRRISEFLIPDILSRIQCF